MTEICKQQVKLVPKVLTECDPKNIISAIYYDSIVLKTCSFDRILIFFLFSVNLNSVNFEYEYKISLNILGVMWDQKKRNRKTDGQF